MAGALNEYLIFPVLELIKTEIRRYDRDPALYTGRIRQDGGGDGGSSSGGSSTGDPFAGTPSIVLYRDHPLDVDRVTGAKLTYASNYTLNVRLTFGTSDVTTIPVEVDSSHPDWDYYKNWRLTQVSCQAYGPQSNLIGNYRIRLLYDRTGRITGTAVDRM